MLSVSAHRSSKWPSTTPKPTWVHILDDRNLGGVKRFVEALQGNPSCRGFTHQLVPTKDATEALGPGKIAIVHEPSSWRSLPYLLRWRARSPVILIEHHYSASFEHWNVLHPQRFRWMLRLAYACAHRVVSISDGQAKWMLQHRLLREDRLRRISPFVDISPFLALPSSIPSPRPTFGAIGRFCQQKGLDLLLHALASVPKLEIRLLLGGYGPDEDHLRRLAEADPRVHWCGRIEDPVAFMARCDAIVVPSRWEPFGLVCLEARAAGREVLVHDVDGLSEQVDGCGHSVAAEIDALAAGLEELYQRLRSPNHEKGRQSARSSVEQSAQGWAEVIAELTPYASSSRWRRPFLKLSNASEIYPRSVRSSQKSRG